MPAGSLAFAVEDVFHITGRGVVLTGTVVTGRLSVGDAILLTFQDPSREPQRGTVTAIEQFRASTDHVGPGDSAGLLIRGIVRSPELGSDQHFRGAVVSHA